MRFRRDPDLLLVGPNNMWQVTPIGSLDAHSLTHARLGEIGTLFQVTGLATSTLFAITQHSKVTADATLGADADVRV